MPWVTTPELRTVRRWHCSCATPEPPLPYCLRCVLCQRETCKNCGQAATDTHDGPRPWYCQRCWTLGEPFRQQMDTLRLAYEQRYDALEDAWKAEALCPVSLEAPAQP